MLDSILFPTDIRELETKMCGGIFVRYVGVFSPQLCDVHDLQCDGLLRSQANSWQFERGQSCETNGRSVRYRSVSLYKLPGNTMLDIRSRITDNSSQHCRCLYWLFACPGCSNCSQLFWNRFVVFGPPVLWIRKAGCLIRHGKIF